jgi:hypothetical protein
MEGFQATGEASSPPKRTSSSSKHEISSPFSCPDLEHKISQISGQIRTDGTGGFMQNMKLP